MTLINNDDKLASSSLDGTIIIWNMSGNLPLQKLKVLQTNTADNSSLPPIVGL
jgi:hypothetical protein